MVDVGLAKVCGRVPSVEGRPTRLSVAFANQGLLDLFDIRFHEFDHDVLEIWKGDVRIGVVGAIRPWRSTPFADAPLAREDPPIDAIVATITFATFALKNQSNRVDRGWNAFHTGDTSGAAVAKRPGFCLQFDQPQLAAPAFIADGACGIFSNGAGFAPARVTTPATSPSQFADLRTTHPARQGCPIDLNAHVTS
jgi:hypothetical protein